MHLKSMTLSGFKSFAQTVKIPFPASRVGIVGPNGCGKSNIIDAIRWVVGERSPKQLRGESMTDVIFNGSASRGPSNRASVELVFDHTVPRLTGPFSLYPEIVVRREVTREGVSQYYLNGARCRRSDVMDLFSGTGLGPRSYAIIEQGMISRIVEASPQELRFYIEEAAGVSRYKDRRQDTESHLDVTQANLARLADMAAEQQTHIHHLGVQSEQALTYKRIKLERDTALKAAAALKWQSLNHRIAQASELLEKQLQEEADYLQALQEQEAAQKKAQEQLQALYQVMQEAQARCSEEEAHFHEAKSAMAYCEREIERLTVACEKVDTKKKQVADNKLSETGLLGSLSEQQAVLMADLQEADRLLSVSMADKNEKEQTWRTACERCAVAEKSFLEAQKQEQDQIRQSDQLQEWIRRSEHRMKQLQDALQNLDLLGAKDRLEKALFSLQSEQKAEQAAEEAWLDLDQQKRNSEQELSGLSDRIREMEAVCQALNSESLALEAMQTASLGQAAEKRHQWLAEQKLDAHLVTGTPLVIWSGWEYAVEVVLGQSIHAFFLEEPFFSSAVLDELKPEVEITLVKGGTFHDNCEKAADKAGPKTLADCFLKGGEWGLEEWSRIYCVDSISEARSLLPTLPAGFSCITPEGVWVSHDWIRLCNAADPNLGFLSRQHRLAELAQSLVEKNEALQCLVSEKTNMQLRLSALQEQWKNSDAARKAAAGSTRHAMQIWMRAEADWQALQKNEERLNSELLPLQESHARDVKKLEDIQKSLAEHRVMVEAARSGWQEAEAIQVSARSIFQEVDQACLVAQDRRRLAEREWEKNEVRGQEMAKLQRQWEEQAAMLAEEYEEIVQRLAEQRVAEAGLREAHEQANSRQASARSVLQAHQAEWEMLQKEQQAQLDAHKALLEKQNTLRQVLEQKKIHLERHRVEAEQLLSDYSASVLQDCLANLVEERSISEWQKIRAESDRALQALGPVNLAAPQEWEEAKCRKAELDLQIEDVSNAVETLKQAIQSIEKEMREQFLKVFDEINAYFQQLFPEMFGGGTASLSLDGDDPLDAGVLMMARPMGKRNQSVHLLSGGEKALTALAFVFGIFQRNPAPFCILDEVDAPLDESNLRRFGQLLEKMSHQVQFIFITHHPVTMSVATHLVGITMQEMGVSRLVSVDIEAALALAEA